MEQSNYDHRFTSSNQRDSVLTSYVLFQLQKATIIGVEVWAIGAIGDGTYIRHKDVKQQKLSYDHHIMCFSFS